MERKPGRPCLLQGCTGRSYTGTFCLRCHEMFAHDLIRRYDEMIKLPSEERWRMDAEFTKEERTTFMAYRREWGMAVHGIDFDQVPESRRG